MQQNICKCCAWVGQIKTLLLGVLVLLLAGCGTGTQQPVGGSIDAVAAVNASGEAGFARVTEPRPFVFPQDHGPHPQYQTEWWYYTGNLATEAGRRFGYQLTFFRSGLRPEAEARPSAWGTTSIYMAHLALSDVASGQFYSFERFSRGGAGLAGASGDPFRVFLEDWSAQGSGPQGMQMRLQAGQQPVALDLQLDSTRPPVLQGEQGYSQKGAQRGNASYYYSLTRMATSGTLEIDGQRYVVEGLSWMDHEFGTSALEEGATGWDWFSLQLENGYDMMYAQVRGAPDAAPLYAFGSLVAPDGSTHPLDPEDVELTVLDTWQSPRTDGTYPVRWRLELPDEDLTLELVPLLADQEHTTSVVYWEGAVRADGTWQGQPVGGYGYVELTGYAETGQARY